MSKLLHGIEANFLIDTSAKILALLQVQQNFNKFFGGRRFNFRLDHLALIRYNIDKLL